ncbi:MAG TPA: hypothetical protein PKW82_00550 [Spirochaetales bacterium]|nr:hypothetical protein [Spirochaetales bacterium]
MSALLEAAVVALAVGGALAFALARTVRTLRGRKTSCCPDPGTPPDACPDRSGRKDDGACGGCPFASGCGS